MTLMLLCGVSSAWGMDASYSVGNTQLSSVSNGDLVVWGDGESFCTGFSSDWGTLSKNQADWIVFTVETTSDGFYLKADDKYVYSSADKKIAFNSSKKTILTIVDKDKDHKNLVYGGTSIGYYTYNSSGIRPYKSNAYTDVHLYKVNAGTTPIINADDFAIEADATSGEFVYSVSNSAEGKYLTASADVDWISDIQVGTEKVTFTTEINTGSTERVGKITLKYEGAANKVISVTQNKPIPTYASLAELVADGSPSETETTVKVTLTNEKIVGKASSYIILQSGEQKVKIYKSSCPDWEVGGTVSGTITCPWVLYNGTDWELKIKDWNELTYNEPIVPKYAITIDPDMVNGSIVAKLNGSAVTEAAEGKEITLEVTPEDGYRLSSNTLIVLDENVEEVPLDVNKFTMPASKVLVSAEFEAIPTHAVKFFVNVEQYGATQTLEEGENVIFPEKPANIGTKVFTGWTENSIDGTTNTAPTFVASATVGDADLNYYAVFATSSPGESETATLNATGLESATYKTGSQKDNKNQTWTYYASVNNQSGTLYFGLNANAKNYNIGSPEFPGYISAISLKAYNGSTKSDRKFFICSSNKTAQPENGDIAEVTISKSEQFTNTYNVDLSAAAPFNQFYIYCNDALGVSEVSVTYSSMTYSGYCTSIPKSLDVAISSVGYSTYSSSFALVVPADETVYGAKIKNENSVELIPVEAGTVIAAGEGFIVKGEANGTVTFTVSSEAGAAISGNELLGTGDETIDLEAGDAYLLAAKDGKAIFGLCDDGVLGENKACLPAPSGANSVLGFDDATGIIAVSNNVINNGAMYNLAGQKVGSDYKGIVIVNGMKFLNK